MPAVVLGGAVGALHKIDDTLAEDVLAAFSAIPGRVAATGLRPVAFLPRLTKNAGVPFPMDTGFSVPQGQEETIGKNCAGSGDAEIDNVLVSDSNPKTSLVFRITDPVAVMFPFNGGGSMFCSDSAKARQKWIDGVVSNNTQAGQKTDIITVPGGRQEEPVTPTPTATAIPTVTPTPTAIPAISTTFRLLPGDTVGMNKDCVGAGDVDVNGVSVHDSLAATALLFETTQPVTVTAPWGATWACSPISEDRGNWLRRAFNDAISQGFQQVDFIQVPGGSQNQ